MRRIALTESLRAVAVLAVLLAACSDVQTVSNDGAGGGTVESNLCATVACDDANDCTNDTCDQSNGDCRFNDLADGTFCDFSGSAGQCASGVCEDAELCQDAGTRCEDMNECTEDTCDGANGACVPVNMADGTSCDFEGAPGVCADGICEDAMLCADAATRCDDSNQCTDDTCNPDTGVCAFAARSGFCSSSVVDLGSVLSDCIMAVCVQRFCDANNDCNDSRDCTTDTCNFLSNRCTNPTAPSGTRCNNNNGRCVGLACVPDVIFPF
jgi:hypothetical protein